MGQPNGYQKLGYVNTLPLATDRWTDTMAYDQYVLQVNSPTTTAQKPGVICIDPYSIFRYGNDQNNDMVNGSYYYDLNTARDVAARSPARPFWVVFMNCQWDNDAGIPVGIPDPTESELRYQIFTPVAYGAKGVMHYSFTDFADPYPGSGFKNNGSRALLTFGRVADPSYYGEINFDQTSFPLCANGTRTKLAVSTEINRYITNIVGPVIMTSNSLGVHHRLFEGFQGFGYLQMNGTIVEFWPPTNQRFPSSTSPILNNITPESSNILTGEFQDKVNSKIYYILVVNKNVTSRTDITNRITTSSPVTLYLKGASTDQVFLAPRCYKYNGSTYMAPVQRVSSRVTNPSAPNVYWNGSQNELTLAGSDGLPSPDNNSILEGGEGRLVKVIIGSGSTNPGFRPQGEIAAVRNVGKVFCFARGLDNSLWYRQQENANNDYWGSIWTSLGGPINGNIVCGFLSKTNSSLYVFSRNSSNYLRLKYQTNPTNNTWNSGWVGSFNTAINSSSNLCVSRVGATEELVLFFKRNSDNQLCYYSAGSSGGFNLTQTPVAVPRSPAIGNTIAAGYNPVDGSVTVFVTDNTSNRRLYSNRYASLYWNSAFTEQNKTDGTQMNNVANIAVGKNSDNRMEVFVVSGGYLWHSWQTSAGGAWFNFSRLTTAGTGEVDDNSSISVGNNPDGRLELFARGSDGFLKHIWQDVNGYGGWSNSLAPIGNFGAASVTVGSNPIAVANYADGRQAVFAPCAGNANIFYTSQVPIVTPFQGDW